MRNRLFGVLALLAALIGAAPVEAACWQWSKTASSNATADPSINWAEGMAPSAVNDSARAMMARLAECRDDISGLLVSAGSSTVYTVTTNQGLAAVPQDGQQIVVRFHTANGAAPTLAADGGTAYAIQTAVGTAVPSATLNANAIYRMTFKLSSTSWLLQDFYNAPIATNSINYDKIQQVTAARLLGNPTGSLANVSEISLGSGLSFVGSVLTFDLQPASFPGYISGVILSTAGSSSSYGVSAGAASDVSSGGIMVLASAITKTTASWSVGSGNGALDTGSIGINTWYHSFLIKRPDTGVVDNCISTSATGCAAGVGNIPAAYTLKRRIGSILTNASNQWVLFVQIGDTFIWSVPVRDANAIGISGAGQNITLTVPTSVAVEAQFIANYVSTTPGSSALVQSLQASSQTTASPFSVNYNLVVPATSTPGVSAMRVMTNTSGQLKAINDGAGSHSFSLLTTGWLDYRGK